MRRTLTDRVRVARWLCWETWRQSLASGLFWVQSGLVLVAVVLCLSVSLAGKPLALGADDDSFLTAPLRERLAADSADGALDDGALDDPLPVADGRLSLGFGLVEVPVRRDAADAIRHLHLMLGSALADTGGLLVALLWTAGFFPAFFRESSVLVLLAKPPGRGELLLGKFLGVLAIVAGFAASFALLTWLTLGGRTGVWDARYLWSAPLLLVNFAGFFCFTTLVAVYSRNAITSVLATLAFWGTCWGVNFGHHQLRDLHGVGSEAAAGAAAFSGGAARTLEGCYWLLPKPYDMQYALYELLGGASHFGDAFGSPSLAAADLPLSLLTGLAFPALLLAGAAWHFRDLEY